MEHHDLQQWISSCAMGVPSQRQLAQLLDDVTRVLRERDELRSTLASVAGTLKQIRAPWIHVRAALNELQRHIVD